LIAKKEKYVGEQEEISCQFKLQLAESNQTDIISASGMLLGEVEGGLVNKE
jgi:hypothetical protein